MMIAQPVRINKLDHPLDILRFAVREMQFGGVALATLVAIKGGAARAIGSHIAICEDGRFCGYVSGGCVEAAIAAEALQAMAEGADRLVTFGDGSPFFDIALPCGGSISITIHVLRDVSVLQTAVTDLENRLPVALAYSPKAQTLLRKSELPLRSEWQDGQFVVLYQPLTRLVLSGQTGEADAVRRLAEAAGYDVKIIDRHQGHAARALDMIDTFTAIVLLHHDLDAEMQVLTEALSSKAFYIGALGSSRTHHRRLERLYVAGQSVQSCARIKAPIGLFGPARDAVSLAFSILAEIAATRLTVFA